MLPSTPTSTVLPAVTTASGSLVAAHDDASAVSTWLERSTQSENTLQSYKRESERFLIWLRYKNLRLAEVMLEDVLQFKRLLSNPPAMWVGRKRPRNHPDWKPFTGPLSPVSIKYALSVIQILYRFLNDARYLSGNPFALLPKDDVPEAPLERYLEIETWERLITFIGELPRETHLERQHAARCRWLFFLLYLTGARRQEVAFARMGDFLIRDGRWWLRVTGKGNKTADIPVPDRLLEELKHYRLTLGLPELPVPGETTPLVGRIRKAVKAKANNGEASLSAQAIYLIVKAVFIQFSDHLKQAGEIHLAELATKMSTHWLRHTSASHQLQNGIPLLHVSQNLRHSNIETTRRYLHTEQADRHDKTRGFGESR
ncbi:tyrosine-type recombinase/integrase [Crenobacter sp. SG2305]|uniref:tyrosine-type recombinase/integrase n=1 Tax=Crenobacter oryzisoli TaxID=3056844 RepID=UPI0025AB3FAE|nr:tyrosine-type recombinase/integrase [Crenobacter sp. SG2305]MDN0082359.1 tyrosine-type recombinase/integrase [Crenobacter sp. SG2305]